MNDKNDNDGPALTCIFFHFCFHQHPGGEETPGREPAKPVDQSGGEEREGNEERGEGKKDDKLLVPIRAERQSQSGQTQPAPTHAGGK